jgi:DNA repair protein RecO (recombination protein O)
MQSQNTLCCFVKQKAYFMQWTNDAIILGRRRFGENHAVGDLLTQDYGRVRGLVRGGFSKRYNTMLQTGNQVRALWQARLENQLGRFQLEPLSLHAAQLYADPVALLVLQTAASHAMLLYEREPHARLYAGFLELLSTSLAPQERMALMIRWEAVLLEDLGFGLDLSRCALTGKAGPLAFVSPHTGRAVCEEAGRPYAHKTLRLPAFLVQSHLRTSWQDLSDGLTLTGHFLQDHIWLPRQMEEPQARRQLRSRIEKALKIL